MKNIQSTRKKIILMTLLLVSISLCFIVVQNFTKLFAYVNETSSENNELITYNPYNNIQTNNWLKGCVHSHTNKSDGENSVEEMAEAFKKNNFDFAFITDHGKITADNIKIEDVLLIKGEEFGTSVEEHNAFFIDDPIDDSSENDAVSTIAEVNEQGGFCQLNHPMRKNIDKEEILNLAKSGLWGIEILNNGDDLLTFSTWDYILSKGIHLWGTFGSDAHITDDVNNGWIVLNSADLSVESIKESMQSGKFYCTNGPAIENIDIDNNIIKIYSENTDIKWYSEGNKIVGEGNSYKINGTETYVRAVVGNEEKFAITQPIFIGNTSEKTEDAGDTEDEKNNSEDDYSIKMTIQELTSIFENSTTELQYTYCENIEDGRGLTFGFAGFCSGTYDGTIFLKEYKKLNPNNKLVKYIPIFEEIDNMDDKENTEGLEDFHNDFASCIDDAKFIEAQQNVCDNLYWNPSQVLIDNIGAKYPITKGQLYDSFINHGENGAKDLVEEATTKAGGTPGSGIDEKEWLSCFLNSRLKMLEEDSTWKESVDRVHVYQKLLEENNYNLVKPMEITCYGDKFTLTNKETKEEIQSDNKDISSKEIIEYDDNEIVLSNLENSNNKNTSQKNKALPITGEKNKKNLIILGIGTSIVGTFSILLKLK